MERATNGTYQPIIIREPPFHHQHVWLIFLQLFASYSISLAERISNLRYRNSHSTIFAEQLITYQLVHRLTDGHARRLDKR
jgi:hypothetical protein